MAFYLFVFNFGFNPWEVGRAERNKKAVFPQMNCQHREKRLWGVLKISDDPIPYAGITQIRFKGYTLSLPKISGSTPTGH